MVAGLELGRFGVGSNCSANYANNSLFSLDLDQVQNGKLQRWQFEINKATINSFVGHKLKSLVATYLSLLNQWFLSMERLKQLLGSILLCKKLACNWITFHYVRCQYERPQLLV